MTMQNTPLYGHSHVNMLLASATIMENVKLSKSFLQAKRSTWTDPFLDGITTQIDAAINNHLGADSAKELRRQTQKIYDILTIALVDLGEVKVQIEVDFDNDKVKRDDLLIVLGFKDNYARAQKRDQEATIKLLYQFNKNLDAATKNELIMKGINDELLENTASHCIKLKNADVIQEVQKGVSREITSQALNEFNQIYQNVVGIAKISRKFYKGDTVKMAQFSYRKIVSEMSNQKPAKTKQVS